MAVSFYVVTDTHFYEPSLGITGRAYEEYMKKEQMCCAENSAILDATVKKLCEDDETKIIVFPGDVSKNGEKASHLGFLRRLETLRENGFTSYVLTARHDFNEQAHNFAGEEFTPVEGTKREELFDLYRDYGFGSALAFDRESLSYVAEIAPGIRMLVLNSDGSPDGHDKGSFDERLCGWIAAQAQKAREDGAFAFAVNHYPIIPPSPVFSFVGDAKMRNWEQVVDLLADNGVPLAFTGHMHIQSIKKALSKQGNEFWDVCTSALVGSPAQYRKVTIGDAGEIKIESFAVPDFEWDMQGLTTREYIDRQFTNMITTIVDAMKNDYEYFMHRIGAKPKKALKIPVTLGGRFINGVTLGGIGRIFWFKVDKSIKKVLLKDFAVGIVRNIFAGDQPYVEGTPEYAAVKKFLSRLGFVLGKLEPKITLPDGSHPDLTRLVLDTIGNNTGISDNNQTIILKR